MTTKPKASSGPLTKEELTARRSLKPAQVELESGGYVTVRGLSRREVVEDLQGTENGLPFERKMLSLGMVEPQMTMEDVAAWQETSPAGEIEPVTLKISELSGLDKGAEKQSYRSFRGEPES